MLKSKIATLKSKMITTAKSLGPRQPVVDDKKMNFEEDFLQNKVRLEAGKRPVGYRTYTSTPEFKLQMAQDLAEESSAVEIPKDGRHIRQNEQGFKIRQTYQIKKWKELSPEDREKWRAEAEKDGNRDVEDVTP
jgi:hypothetical protein